jgi:UDP-N-acetylmuramoyl-tripeptide--D-alanyl-D-alanine ligase
VQNSLAVLAAVKLADADLKAGARALAGWRAQTGRGERIVIGDKGARVAIIDESYNANPASMRAALATLGLTPRDEFKRRVAVLGDMLELGVGTEAAPGACRGHRRRRCRRRLCLRRDDARTLRCVACKPPRAYAKTSEQLAPLLTRASGPATWS